MGGQPDIVIIGSGIGGATMAAGLAASGADILILEAGERLPDRPENRDPRAIFQRGFFRPQEFWYETNGAPFNPGNHYNVGGNSKLFAAVLPRYRREEPWYCKAEELFQVRGELGDDPTEPHHSKVYPYPAVRDERPIADVRARLKKAGLHPASLPLGVDIDRWLAKAKTPWDAHPNCDDGKMDAESCPLAQALQYPNVRLETSARVPRVEAGPDGKAITAVHYVTRTVPIRLAAIS